MPLNSNSDELPSWKKFLTYRSTHGNREPHRDTVTINKLGLTLPLRFVCSPACESVVEKVAPGLKGGHLICLDSMTPKFLSSRINNSKPTQRKEEEYVIPEDYLYIFHSFQSPPLENKKIRAFLDENANYNYYLK